MASWREIFAGLALLAGANAQNAPRFEPPDPTVRDGDIIKFWGSDLASLGEYNMDMEFVLHESVELIFDPLEESFDEPPICTELTIEENDPFYPQREALDYPYFLQCTVTGIKAGAEYDLRISYDIPGIPAFEPCSANPEDDIEAMLEMDEDWMMAPTGDNGVSTCFTITGVEAQELTRDELLAEVRSKNLNNGGNNRKRRSGSPSISYVVPNAGSRLGGQLITVAGQNLASAKLNIPGATADESSPDGDDYVLWFEMAGQEPKLCVFDRHLTILARHMGDYESILCRTPAVHKGGTWRIKLIIDGGEIITGPTFRFETSYGPEITWATPYFSTPAAHPEERFLEERSFWSMWIDIDRDNDGNEHEQFSNSHRYRKLYLAGACRTPIDWEVFDKNNNQTFVQSVNFNSDGLPRAQTFNLKEGFVCSDSAQTETGGDISMCPDVKIRYLCSENALDFQGRLYTVNFNAVDDGNDDDPNRMFFQPRFIAEDGAPMGECEISVKTDEATETELFRQITSGNNGIVRCLSTAQEPGQYNFTFTTQNEGASIPSSNFVSFLGNEHLDPFHFEVYPMIRSVYPNIGSAEGGTVITITGTGFESSLGETAVELGGKSCEIITHSATEITCITPKIDSQKRIFDWGPIPEGANDCPDNDIFGSNITPTQDACRRNCEDIGLCTHYIWDPNNNYCWIKKNTPSCRHVNGHDHLVGGIALDIDKTNAIRTTSCRWVKGVGYEGTLAVDRNGDACQPGTFCRNADGLYNQPACNSTASNTFVECEIIVCDRAAQFPGSRGASVRYTSNAEAYRYGQGAFNTHYEAGNFEIVDSSYFSGSEEWKWFGRWNRDHYSARNQFFYEAPQTGWFRFFFSFDDIAVLYQMNEDGSYEKLYDYGAWSPLFDFDNRGHNQQTKDLYLVKGQKQLYEFSFREWAGGDHANIGIQWLGDFTNGRYEDDFQSRIGGYFKAHSRRGKRTSGTSQSHNLIFVMNYTGLDWEGETPIPEERKIRAPIFRLMYCGDNVNGAPNCRITRNMATAMWQLNSNSDRQNRIENVIKYDILRNKVEYTANPPFGEDSYWNNVKLYTSYEDNSVWPGASHHKTEYGQYKGSKAFRTKPGYHVYNYGKGYLQYNGDDEAEMQNNIKHWCVAVKGGVSFLYSRLNFYYYDADGVHKWFSNWWWMADDDNMDSQYTSPNDGRDWGYHCFNLVNILDTQAANKGISIDWQNDVWLTEMRMWARHDDRFDPDPDRKWRFENTVLDESAFGDYGFEQPETEITAHAFQVDGKVIHNVDASITKGDDHNVVLTYSATNTNACSFSVPLPMVVEPDATELYERGLDDFDHVGTGVNQTMDFITETTYEILTEKPADLADYSVQLGREGAYLNKAVVDINYSGYYYRWDTPVDGTRMRFDAYAVERTVNSESTAAHVTTTVTFDTDESGESYSFTHATSAATVQSEMRSKWEHLQKMDLRVTRHGDCKNGYYYDFKGNARGNLGQLTAVNVVSEEFIERNEDVANAFYDVVNDFWQGGPYQRIIPGSMMSIPKHVPEVVVVTNGQRSKCGAHYQQEMNTVTWTDNMLDGCSFTISADHTPAVYATSVSEEDIIAEGDIITVDVTFPGDTEVSSESFVEIGGARCEINSYEEVTVGPVNGTFQATRLTVTVGEIPSGEQLLTFRDPAFGIAKSEIMIQSLLTIDSYSPESGSIYGGSIVTVIGRGFEEGIVVQVFDSQQDCISIEGEVTYNEMKCVTQPADEAERRKRRQIFDESTPSITGMSRTKISVLGGDSITITGSAFGLGHLNLSRVDVQGLFDANECVPDPKYVQRGCLGYRTSNSGDWEITSWTDTEIVATTAMLDQGAYELQITSAENGFSNKFNFDYAVEVSGVSPRYSSLVGGRMVTISGFGFATDTITPNSKLNADTTVEVFAVGGLSGFWRNRCHVKQVSATEIVCETGYAVNEPILMSTGENFENITIKAGEAIRWKWSFTVDGGSPNMQFQECDEPNCEEATSDDKIWGPTIKESTGDFVKLFETPGTYYYSTGFIDNAFSSWLNGMIVVEEAVERPEWLEVIVTDSFSDRQWGGVNEKWPHIAAHVGTPPPLDGSDDGASELAGCTATTTNTATMFDGELEKHSIIYSWAFTPVATDMSSDSDLTPFMDANLTVTNFEVSGDCAAATQFAAVERYGPEIRPKNFFFKDSEGISGTYTIDHADMMDPLMEYEFDFVLAGRGRAYYNSYDGSARFRIRPIATAVSKASVGIKGGWELTITGAGFVAPDKDLLESDDVISIETEIHLGRDPAYRCEISSVSYTEVTCRAPEMWRGVSDRSENLAIFFRHDNDFYNTDNSFDINQIPVTASFAVTPQISAVLPASGIAHDTTQVTFQGLNLDGASILVAGQELTGCSGDASSQTCDAPSLAAGAYQISGTADNGIIYVAPQVDVKSIFFASSISPTSGSVNGGQQVTVSGSGWSEDISVTIRQNGGIICSRCPIVSIAEDLVIAMPSAKAVGAASIEIKHEYIEHDLFEFEFSFVNIGDGNAPTTSTDVSSLTAGDSVTLDLSSGSCSGDLRVDLVLNMSPCAEGAHNCHYAAECTPNPDGIQYTCACQGIYQGDGFSCAKYDDKTARVLSDVTESDCYHVGTNFIWSLAKFESIEEVQNALADVNDEIYLNIKYSAADNSLTHDLDGTAVVWFDDASLPTEDSCLTYHSETTSFNFVPCSSSKRIICESYDEEDCISDEGQYYRGDLAGSEGFTCVNWADVTVPGTPTEANLDLGNACRNPDFRSQGPFCYISTEITEGKTEPSWIQCPIPNCAMKDHQICQVVTESGAIIGRTHDRYVLNPTHNDFYDNRKNIQTGFAEFDDGFVIYKFKNNKNPDSNFECWEVKDGTDEDEPIMAIERRLNDCRRWQKQLQPDGSYRLSQGNHFLRENLDNRNKMQGQLLTGLLYDEDTISGMSFDIQCGHPGSHKKSGVNPVEILHELSGSCSGDALTLSMPAVSSGSYSLRVRDSTNGYFAGKVDVSFSLALDSISPANIGQSGGQPITLSGAGFSADSSSVTVDGIDCVVQTVSADGSELTCIFEDLGHITESGAAAVVVSVTDKSTGNTLTAESSVFVDISLTPMINGFSPTRGGSAGGTRITFTGSNLDVGDEAIVSIHGVVCITLSRSASELICETEPYSGLNIPVQPMIEFTNFGNGLFSSTDLEFWYIDRWSSTFTWGCTDGSCKPMAGDIVVIPEGKVILLDESTPILAVLIVDGGTVLWDRQHGIELSLEYAVVTNGGHFEIGNEDEPFCDPSGDRSIPFDATITMYGHQRSIELPIYGAKVFAVRRGTIDLHGCRIHTSWTHMDATAEVGDNTITLTHPVADDWVAGDQIIIATTGDVMKLHHSETAYISSVSADGYTLTLNDTLRFRHMAECADGFDWAGTICQRAEVGLLSKNVKFQGNRNLDWVEDLDECELGIGTAFGVQTCFQNRFGHEVGSDQLGGHLFLHMVDHARVQFCEFNFVGQAFRLGRYPIHFHMTGDVENTNTYIRGNSIHEAFNRALTMHGIHNLLVEHNVAFNVMGLTFFLEDGIEEDNIIQYNLAVMTKKSSSLLNIDSIPSSFWMPNPNNVVRHNAVAGSTHFGYWFNSPTHPTGPSATRDICCKQRPLGEFWNNTVHSSGKYGLWVFVDLVPTGPNGDCGEGAPKALKIGEIPANATMPEGVDRNSVYGLHTWNNERGAEITTGGAIQFHNFIASDNKIAGLAGKETYLNSFGVCPDVDCPGNVQAFVRSLVIGRMKTDPHVNSCGSMGIETPWEEFAFTVHDMHFFNFDAPGSGVCTAVNPCYGSDAFDCAATTWYTDVRWTNSPRKLTTDWEHEYAIRDIDGTFTENGGEEVYVVPRSAAYDPNHCSTVWPGPDGSNAQFVGRGVQICPYEDGKFKPHRFPFNNVSPPALAGTNTKAISPFGTATSPFRVCRPLGRGWMMLLAQGQEHVLSWDGYEHVTNISYSAQMHTLEQNDYVHIAHEFYQRIDYTNLGAKLDEIPTIDNETHNNLDYYITSDEEFISTREYKLTYMLRGLKSPTMSSTKGIYPAKYEVDGLGDGTHGRKSTWSMRMYKCFYPQCIKPTTTTQPPTTTTTEETITCELGEPGCEDSFTVPGWDGNNETNVFISEKRIIRLTGVPEELQDPERPNVLKATKFLLDGELIIEDIEEDIEIEIESFIVNSGISASEWGKERKRRDLIDQFTGKLVIGTAENPIPCDKKVTIRLMGNVSEAEEFGALGNSIPIGAKALGGYGSVEMHGCPRDKTWTYLETTMQAGENTITLSEDADWQVGEEISIASSNFDQKEVEFFSITEKVGRTYTLNDTAQFRHFGIDTALEDAAGHHLGAPVMLLTRNIIIDGSDGANGQVGGRVLIASTIEKDGDDTIFRSGYGQFSYVQFKQMGQFGYNAESDSRFQLLFYNIDPTASGDRKQSYVRGCSFFHGLNTAIGSGVGVHGLEMTDNVIVGAPEDGIRILGNDAVVNNNAIASIWERSVWAQLMQGNSDFDEAMIPAGIDFKTAQRTTMKNNHVAGVMGPCFHSYGQTCTGDLEECTSDVHETDPNVSGNVGSGCLIGYYILKQPLGRCQKVSGFFLHHTTTAVYFQSTTQRLVVSDNVLVDNSVALYTVHAGPNAESKRYDPKASVTYKNNIIIGRSEHWQCGVDDEVSTILPLGGFSPGTSSVRDHAAIVGTDFLGKYNKFPGKPMYKAFVKTPAIYGRTCVLGNAFTKFDGRCGNRDVIFSSNSMMEDYSHPTYFKEGNTFDSNVADITKIAKFMRPSTGLVNIADCVDLHCDGHKKQMIIDETGDLLGTPGLLHSESEYKWEGVTRNGHTYTDTRPGLGDYRIPKGMLTTLDGDRIPVDDYAPEKGVVRDENCSYEPDLPGWKCTDSLKMFMMNYQFMDVDHMVRRVSPLAIRSETGYIDIINGPADHSCCIGYACMIRLSTFWSHQACNLHYDYYFTSTIPKRMNFHLPDYNEPCKIYVTFYTQKPNRIDVKQDGIYMIPTNARYIGDNIEWERPRREIHLPSLDGINTAAGTNFFDRQEQAIHMILETGHIYGLQVKSTLILELDVMTELTNDEFYDNGNIAVNIAALLGISPSRIKIVNVIRETNDERRKRREASGLYYFGNSRLRREGDAESSSLQFEIASNNEKPEDGDNELDAEDLEKEKEEVDALNGIGATLAKKSLEDGNPLGAAAASAIVDQDPSVSVGEVAVGMADPPTTNDDLPEWFDEENPVGESIIQKLGLDEEAIGVDEPGSIDFDALRTEILAASDGEIDLETAKTAEETANEKQAAKDTAAEPIIYKVPTTMIIDEEPTGLQIEQVDIQTFVLHVLDQDGEMMTVVGFPLNPATCTVSLKDGETGQILGESTVPFEPGTGYATFSAFQVNGTDMSVEFEFNIGFPADFDLNATVPAVFSSAPLEFLAMPDSTGDGECEVFEGEGFDKQEIWNEDCSLICTLPCQDAGGLLSTVPKCQVRDTTECGSFGSCNDGVGCECDLASMPRPDQINVEDHISFSCDSEGMVVKVDKCVMHKFGFRLEHLGINGIDRSYDGPLRGSGLNTCVGKLDYETGTDYKFTLYGGDACGMEKTFNETHIVYHNAVSGSFGINQGGIKRRVEMYSQFACAFETSIRVSAAVGSVGRSTIHKELKREMGIFDASLMLFTDMSYSTPVTSTYVVEVPQKVYVGAFVADLNPRYALVLNTCTLSIPGEDDMTHDVVTDSCVNPDETGFVSIYNNGDSDQSRFSFDSFMFLGFEEHEQTLTCSMKICDTESEACTPSCGARRRRSSSFDEGKIIQATVRYTVRKEQPKISRWQSIIRG